MTGTITKETRYCARCLGPIGGWLTCAICGSVVGTCCDRPVEIDEGVGRVAFDVCAACEATGGSAYRAVLRQVLADCGAGVCRVLARWREEAKTPGAKP